MINFEEKYEVYKQEMKVMEKEYKYFVKYRNNENKKILLEEIIRVRKALNDFNIRIKNLYLGK